MILKKPSQPHQKQVLILKNERADHITRNQNAPTVIKKYFLKLRLHMHAKQEYIKENEVDRAFNKAVNTTTRRGLQRTGKRKDLSKKWCPVTFVTCHICQQLAKKHLIKAGGYLESMLNPLTPASNCPRPTPNFRAFYGIFQSERKPKNKPYAQ